ncbi:MAG TPA: glycosyltransferase family 39 protein [Candidatus Acidoferrales bacterium]|nr:glycosyltransferase family 39 protein [Candidatus Acidoferrales bacterium]
MMDTLSAASIPRDYTLDRDVALRSRVMLLALACCKVLIQLAGINHYGFFRDELYYIACGQHPAWGYVDQPPLIAFVAWFARHLLGTSLFATRLFPVLAGVAVVYATGRVAAELGGGLFAQFLAATAILFAPAYLAFDSFLSMNAFEPLFWLLCAWIAIRIVKGASPRLWLLFGAVAGVGLENKHSMLVFGFAFVAGLLLSGQARLFRSKWMWLGAGVALAIFLPNVLWEARNGWPQIEVVRNAQQFKNEAIGPLQFLFEQVLFMQPLALPVWLAGLWWYFAAPEGKPFRFLGWSYVFVLVIFIVLRGKSYYALPIYPLLMAAGGVALEGFFAAPKRRWMAVAFPALLIIAGLVTLPFGTPLLPVDTFLRYAQLLPYANSVKTERDATTALPQLYADMFGWDNMATQIAQVYRTLPQSEQSGCAILAGNYGEAGAIDHFGPTLGLPAAISGHNSYYFWGPHAYTGACVILFGERADELKDLFGDAQLVRAITDPHAAVAERNVHVYICRKPRAPLAELWPHFKLII